MTTTIGSKPDPDVALSQMQEREEVLQICFWYLGEGLGDKLNPQIVQPFLNSSTPEAIAETFQALESDGDFEQLDGAYAFTQQGKEKAARMFADTFTEFQMAAHYECTAGCCDGDEVCDHDHDHSGHGAHG